MMRPGKEYQLAGTGAPPARAWATTAPEAVNQYVRAFRVQGNVLVRQVAAPEAAELFTVGPDGLRRLVPGGGR